MGIALTKNAVDLGIVTTNGPAMLAFYRDVIGLRLLYRTPRFVRFDATQGTSLSLIAGGSRWPGPGKEIGAPSSGSGARARSFSPRR